MKSEKAKEIRRAILFTLFSLSAGIIQLVTGEIMMKVLNWDYWVSYILALILSVLWNFTFNRNVTFASAANVPVAMLKVAAFYAVFTPASTWGGAALVGIGWNEDVVFILSMLLNFVLEFLYDRFFVFGNSMDTRGQKPLPAYLGTPDEKPLDRMVTDGGYCGIFRTIACVGDSLSSGEFEGTGSEGQKTYHDFYDFSWGQYIARAAGCKVYNFSRGGMTAKEFCETWGDANGCWDADKAAHAYIIAMGANDLHGKKQPIGSIADIDPDDPTKNADTFAGWYARIIQQYKAISPDAKFFLMTFPQGEEGDNSERAKQNAEMRELLYTLAEYFDNTYVLDIAQYGPVYDNEFKYHFYLGGHLNPAGYIFTAQMTMSYIDYIIRHNMRDFRQVGFIGTPFKNTADV